MPMPVRAEMSVRHIAHEAAQMKTYRSEEIEFALRSECFDKTSIQSTPEIDHAMSALMPQPESAAAMAVRLVSTACLRATWPYTLVAKKRNHVMAKPPRLSGVTVS